MTLDNLPDEEIRIVDNLRSDLKAMKVSRDHYHREYLKTYAAALLLVAKDESVEHVTNRIALMLFLRSLEDTYSSDQLAGLINETMIGMDYQVDVGKVTDEQGSNGVRIIKNSKIQNEIYGSDDEPTGDDEDE